MIIGIIILIIFIVLFIPYRHDFAGNPETIAMLIDEWIRGLFEKDDNKDNN